MYIISFLLLLASLTKLYLVMTLNRDEILESLSNNPAKELVPGIFSAILIIDGLLGGFCSIFIMCYL